MSYFLNLRLRPTGGGVVDNSTDIAITQAAFSEANYIVAITPSQSGQDPSQLAQFRATVLGKKVLLSPMAST